MQHVTRHQVADSSELPSSVQIINDSNGLKYTAPWLNSAAVIPSVWLRDHCPCEACKHPSTKQRLLEFEDLEGKTTPASISAKADGYQVNWIDGHESFYSLNWLTKTLDKRDHRTAARQGLSYWKPWPRDARGNVISPEVNYTDVMQSDRGVGEWLLKVRQYGYCYVAGCPPTPEATDELLQRIAYVRNTHYGGFWDFTSDLSKGDTAYTQLGIGPHTDNTYFTDPAGLQLFHLLSHTGGSGGESGLVDGFAAANALLQEHPEAYNILATVPIHCHASGNEGMSLWPATGYPVLVHDPTHGHLVQVRWNNTDRAEIELPVEDTVAWYEAASKWVKTLKQFELSEQLKPGRPLSEFSYYSGMAVSADHTSVFDNWRVLHARTAFTGKRRMCGGYSKSQRFSIMYY